MILKQNLQVKMRPITRKPISFCSIRQ